MNDPTPPDPLSRLLIDQRARWKRGERLLVEAYLAREPFLTAEAIVALIHSEIILRRENGETTTEAEYQARFPQWATNLHVLFEEEHSDTLSARTALREGTESPELVSPPETAAAALPRITGYEILGVLNRGGMGVVYRARQLGLNRMVALKMLLTGDYAGQMELARFHREAEAVARLQHPHIVQVFEAGEHAGHPFFSMEFVEGGTLEQKTAGAPQAPQAAAQIVETLARAMHWAHQQGIIHRDLKPANVLLAGDGTPKIADFGLAKGVEAGGGQTRTGDIMGTPGYMAPEQASGKANTVDSTTDVYALGGILYHQLTGRPPFKGATAWDTVIQVLSDEPIPPRHLQPTVPRDLETICLKCLHKDGWKRYATAEALAEDLRRFRCGEPIQARPIPLWERGLKWTKRQPTTALAGLLLLITLAVGGYLATRPPPPADFNWDFEYGELAGTSSHKVKFVSPSQYLREGRGFLRFWRGGESRLEATFIAKKEYLDPHRGSWEFSISHRSTLFDDGEKGHSPVRVSVNGNTVWSSAPEHLDELPPPAPYAFVENTTDITPYVQRGTNVLLLEHVAGATTNYWLRSFRVRWVPRRSRSGS